MADTYTHKDLAALCGVSETTIKSYRRKFPGYVPVLTRGKPIRFKKEAGEVCLAVRDCFAKGMSVNETLKVLQGRFRRQLADRTRRTAPAAAATSPEGVVSQEYLEKFFETAGQMMQGMAAMATAQAKANQRLERLESALDKLLEIETRNGETFAELLSREPSSAPKPAQPELLPDEPAEKESKKPTKPAPTRKIVNVQEPEGGVTSYTLEKEPDGEAVERPSDEFLDTPIVIRNEQGEFLGVPGRLPVRGFVDILLRDGGEAGPERSGWTRSVAGWTLALQMKGEALRELSFASTTTPRGNLVVLLERMAVAGAPADSSALQAFFRQIKDKV